jgi:hypothetical protein
MKTKKSWGVRNVLILNLQTLNGAHVGLPNAMPPAFGRPVDRSGCSQGTTLLE